MSRPSASQLRDIAQGRWVQILIAAGIPAEFLDGRGHPCPRCGGTDRFAAFDNVDDRGAVHCRHCFTRGTNPRPGDGLATLMWIQNVAFADAVQWLIDYLGIGHDARRDGGYSGFLPIPIATSRDARPAKRQVSAAEVERMTRLTADAMRRISSRQFQTLSEQLGVSVDSLRSLCVGYSADHGATTWPMRDANGRVIGIRLRSDDGRKKWSVTGSHAGLFISRSDRPRGDAVYIVEGASDMCAAIDLGLPSIGRPSCRGLSLETCDYMSRVGYRCATVIADNDPPGRAGARDLARDLSIHGFDAQVAVPPNGTNDLRQYVMGRNHPIGFSLETLYEFAAKPVMTQLAFDFVAVPQSVP
ncbi:MAG: hypothetical protein HKN47_04285 [Pirellulaceae bacterium]|nr:hypothetical protein [Pirellulaceae bacterium]